MWFSKKSNPQSNPQPEPATTSATPMAAPTSSQPVDWLRASVSRISRDHVQPGDIDIRAHLLDSGYVDSLSATELLAGIERQFGVRIQEVDIVGRLCTIEALAREIDVRATGAAR
jgi:acyl carrier protein